MARFTAFGFGDGLLSAYARALQTSGKRISADHGARRRAAQLGNPTGRLIDPTLTMHTVHDPLVIVQNERVFAKRVAQHGRDALLSQLYVRPPSYTTAAPYGAGHCNFSTDQWLAAAVGLSDWVKALTDRATLSSSRCSRHSPGRSISTTRRPPGPPDRSTAMRRTAIGGAILAVSPSC